MATSNLVCVRTHTTVHSFFFLFYFFPYSVCVFRNYFFFFFAVGNWVNTDWMNVKVYETWMSMANFGLMVMKALVMVFVPLQLLLPVCLNTLRTKVNYNSWWWWWWCKCCVFGFFIDFANHSILGWHSILFTLKLFVHGHHHHCHHHHRHHHHQQYHQ